MDKYALEAISITKQFPGVIANDNVNIKVEKNEIHGLIGENGAGKSTLLKVLNGVYPYETYKGTIKINGKTVNFTSPMDALEKGLGFVPQEINILNNLTVAENIYVNNFNINSKSRIVSMRKIFKKAQSLLSKYKISLDPTVHARMLSIGQQQLLMIAKALSKDPKVLILDEPTTSLSLEDVKNLFEILRNLKKTGTSIIFVTHKLDEIMEITDKVTILRDGKNISTFSKEKYDKEQIVTDMIGRKISNLYPKRDVQLGEEVLRIENLTVEHPKIMNRNLIEDISFSLRKGEILGLAGLVGAGRTETLEAIFGIKKIKKGKIFINGKQVNICSIKDAIENRMSLVTEDRKKNGLLFLQDIKRNLMINNHKAISKYFIYSKRLEEKRAKKIFNRMNIKAPSLETKVISLSGGNQQKVVIGRAMNSDPLILLLDEPTKGIDVGSKNDIYLLMNELVSMGVSIILISSELTELLEMSDRFIVLSSGKIVGKLDKSEASDKKVMMMATKS